MSQVMYCIHYVWVLKVLDFSVVRLGYLKLNAIAVFKSRWVGWGWGGTSDDNLN